MLSEKERKTTRIGHSIRVLIVEDSEDDTELMLRYLKKGGFYTKSRRVQSADALRDALKKEKWDIVLCDHNMPGFDSISALKIVNSKRPYIPFMLISESVPERVAEVVKKNGARATISKSNLHQLVPAVVKELKVAKVIKNYVADNRPKKHNDRKRRSDGSQSTISLFAADSSHKKADIPEEISNKDSNNGKNNRNQAKGGKLVNNILIVEDELIQSILLEKLINSLGYKVVGKATTGAAAIEMALSLQPDLITMDISLQDDIDGIMATKTIQDKNMIPVIYISGNSDKYNFERAEKTNFIDFIPKPVSKESLAKSINKAEFIEANK